MARARKRIHSGETAATRLEHQVAHRLLSAAQPASSRHRSNPFAHARIKMTRLCGSEIHFCKMMELVSFPSLFSCIGAEEAYGDPEGPDASRGRRDCCLRAVCRRCSAVEFACVRL